MANDTSLPEFMNGLIDDLEAWYRKLDGEIRTRNHLTLIQDNKTEADISCRTCTSASCCKLSIFEPLYAGLPIARHLRVTHRDTPELRERIRLTGEDMEGSGRDAWFEKNVDCLFLNENRRCSIYQLRPIACRKYTVVTPSEWCDPPPVKGRLIASIDMAPITASSMLGSAQLANLLGLKQNRFRVFIGTFPRMVYISLLLLDYVATGGADLNTFLRQFPWPSEANGDAWLSEGQNPFRNAT